MNEAQRRAIKERQKKRVADAMGQEPAPAVQSAPTPPARPMDELVAELRPNVGPGAPVAYLRFLDKSFQVAGMQSGERVDARKQANGREHRIELIRSLDCFLVTHIDPARRLVEFDFVERSAVKTWRLTPVAAE